MARATAPRGMTGSDAAPRSRHARDLEGRRERP